MNLCAYGWSTHAAPPELTTLVSRLAIHTPVRRTWSLLRPALRELAQSGGEWVTFSHGPLLIIPRQPGPPRNLTLLCSSSKR